MASLYGGFRVRALHGHRTHDGFAFSARLYLHDTPVGNVENDGRGGTRGWTEPAHRDALQTAVQALGPWRDSLTRWRWTDTPW